MWMKERKDGFSPHDVIVLGSPDPHDKTSETIIWKSHKMTRKALQGRKTPS